MNKLLLVLPILALVTLGVVFVARHKNHDLMEGTNTTTFTQWRTCTNGLKKAVCDDVQDETEKTKCYAASFGVSSLTFIDGQKLTPACKNFLDYQTKAQASDLLNGNDYYKNCYDSDEVTWESYKSKFYYEQIYYPIYLGCAGF